MQFRALAPGSRLADVFSDNPADWIAYARSGPTPSTKGAGALARGPETSRRRPGSLPHRRASRRYPSDTTEWALIEPLLPVPACRTPTGGRPEAHPRREIVDAIRYVVDNGIKWRVLPADFPPWQTSTATSRVGRRRG
jgi:hypothetical protein